MFRIAIFFFLLLFAVNLSVWSHLEDEHATIARPAKDENHTYPVHIRGVGTLYFSDPVGSYLRIFAPATMVGSLVLAYLCGLADRRRSGE